MNKTLLVVLCLAFASPALAEKEVPSLAAPDQAASRKIDQLIGKQLKAEEMKPNPIASDEIFVRRVYLDTIGRIPTKRETLEFLNSDAEGKRSALIGKLLGSQGYVSHNYNYWADVLRAKTDINGNSQSRETGYAYELWIKDAIRKNMPYDKMVKQLVSASGKSWENGAVGYYIRDYGMPLDNLAITTQVFLGTQIVCAQCHNHPFDEWTQMDYYHLAAFTYGMVTTNRSENQQAVFDFMREKKYKRPRAESVKSAMTEILKPLRFNSVDTKDRDLKLPHDYQYDDAKPKSVVQPASIMGPEAPLSGSAPPVEAFSEWLTSRENPRFTRVIANRMWRRAFGVGLIEPVDDIRSHTKASNEELMVFLEKKMQDFDFDLRRFQEMIFNTRAYQREVVTEELTPGIPYHFPGPVLRRMSAEQIWDSVVSMVRPGVDRPDRRRQLAQETAILKVELLAEAVYDQPTGQFLKNSLEVAKAQRALSIEIEKAQSRLASAREAEDEKEIDAAVDEVQQIRRRLASIVEDKVYRKGLQQKVSLVAMNELPEGKVAKSVDESRDFLNRIAVEITEDERPIGEGFAEMASADRGLINELATAMMEDKVRRFEVTDDARKEKEREAWKATGKNKETFRDYQKIRNGFKRASDIDSPAPGNHFLRAFGQSDRELVENGSDQASITQALHLLNSPVRKAVTNRYSVLFRDLKGETFRDRLDTVFLTMLSREPEPEERQLFSKAFQQNPEAGSLNGIVWTLLNTRQFLFIQ